MYTKNLQSVIYNREFHKTLIFDAISGDKIVTVNGLYEAIKKRIRNKDSNL